MLEQENRRETRSMNDRASGSMSKSSKSVDHNYNLSNPSSRAPLPDYNKCHGCKKTYEKNQKKIQCGFCEFDYCMHCSVLNRSTFEALSGCEAASWYCPHCVHAIPGVKKLLVRVGNVENKCDDLNERVQTLENKDEVSADSVKGLLQEEMLEMKEIEGRRLNMICLNLQESRKSDLNERKEEDLELINNLMQNRMDLDPDEIKVNKLIRLGRRAVSKDGVIKSRPLRFTVELFEHKRIILKANSLLRSSDDSIFSNVYFTPDLTKNQRKIAFKLTVERRLREEKGEQNLKIT